ncbi:phage tail tape measure protein [Escherichia coli]|uniref:phage tail tape measure protein n=1 Tax=Escherichia coli TaxID=562 RepID=UPI002074D9AA|nr:phage tail tape measure protein [Escherichia coli]
MLRIGPLGGVAGVASGEIAQWGQPLPGWAWSQKLPHRDQELHAFPDRGKFRDKIAETALRFLRINPKKLAADMQKDARGTMLSVLDAMAKVPKEKQAAVLNALFGKESLGAIALC